MASLPQRPVTKHTKLPLTIPLEGPAVLVTNASDFVSQHVIFQLLLHGSNVIGTVTDHQVGTNLIQSFNNSRLAIVDVKDTPSMKGKYDIVFQSYSDITQVIHVADTFSNPIPDYPAGVLQSIMNYGQRVQKVLLTSSFHAVANHIHFGSPYFFHDESTWNPVTWEMIEDMPAGNTRELCEYELDKVEEETELWEFMRDNWNRISFNLNVVIAPVILGPLCLPTNASASFPLPPDRSTATIRMLAFSKFSKLKSFSTNPWPTVDVRDLAAVLIRSSQDPNIRGERLLAIGSGFYSDFLAMSVIFKEFELFRDTVALDYVDLEAPSLNYTCYQNNPIPRVDNSRTRHLLGPDFHFKSFRNQVKAAMDSWIRNDWEQLTRHARHSAGVD